MANQAEERRRDYMVNRRVQMLYLATWGFSLLLVVSFAVFTYLLSQASKPIAQPAGASNIYAFIGINAFLIILCALGLGVYTIVHTHRMMGSAYRIGQYLRDLNQGKAPGPLSLRDKDYFQEVADEVNALRAKLGDPKAPDAEQAAAAQGDNA